MDRALGNGADDTVSVQAGRLLVAMPGLTGEPFRRSVVLLLDHDHSGSLGVVLNRPTEVAVGDVLPDWRGDVSEPDTLFEGGPVSQEAALAVGLLRDRVAAGADQVLGWRSMFGRVGLVDLDAPTALLSGALSGLRIFAGYAGWSPGQLDAEIDEGSWLVLRGRHEDLTSPRPASLWVDVLRRQQGRTRLLATCPTDPTRN